MRAIALAILAIGFFLCWSIEGNKDATPALLGIATFCATILCIIAGV